MEALEKEPKEKKLSLKKELPNEVAIASFHQPVMVLNIFTETVLSGVKHPGLKMYWQPWGKVDGLLVKYKNRTVIIPKAGVQNCIMVGDVAAE